MPSEHLRSGVDECSVLLGDSTNLHNVVLLFHRQMHLLGESDPGFDARDNWWKNGPFVGAMVLPFGTSSPLADRVRHGETITPRAGLLADVPLVGVGPLAPFPGDPGKSWMLFEDDWETGMGPS